MRAVRRRMPIVQGEEEAIAVKNTRPALLGGIRIGKEELSR
jgi:hypothetical protein